MAALNVLQPLKYSPFLYSKGEYKFACQYVLTANGKPRWAVIVEKNDVFTARDSFEDSTPKKLQKSLVEKYVTVKGEEAPTPAPAPVKGRGRPAARGKVASNVVAVRFTDREYDLLQKACQPGEGVGQMLRRLVLKL